MKSTLSADIKRFFNIRGAWPLVVGMFCYGIGTGILAPMNAIYLQERIGLSKGEIAAIFASALLFNMILTMTVGIVSDKITNKKALPLAAAFVCICGLLLYMRADGFPSAFAGMAIATAPSGMIMGQLYAMARKRFTKEAGEIVEMAMLWLRATFSVGFFGGLLLGANLYLIATFRGVLWGNLAGYAILFLLLWIYKDVKEAENKLQTDRGEPFSIWMLVALLLLGCGDAIRGLYLPLVVNQLFDRAELMSYLWSVQAVFELVFMTLTGYWAARYGSKRIILLGSLFALATYAVYAFGPPLSLFFLMQPIHSFYVSIFYGVAMGYVQRMFISRAGFGASLYVFITQAATLVGYVFPLVIKGITPRIFLIGAALVVAAIFCMIKSDVRIAKSKSRPLHESG
ncbi:MFS transporter [Cohnella terricola]|uniref:MFS transporter n=1 Tax=Cohnella terricola TaxID=1289167 RepID=A0A559IUX6_9BACL|nr:MFS transporter [Cohnella terricola]TVX91442.1 MFS transporter [Cohnella terricola]